MVGWLVGLLVGWLVVWLVGWLVGWFVGWLVGWLVLASRAGGSFLATCSKLPGRKRLEPNMPNYTITTGAFNYFLSKTNFWKLTAADTFH